MDENVYDVVKYDSWVVVVVLFLGVDVEKDSSSTVTELIHQRSSVTTQFNNKAIFCSASSASISSPQHPLKMFWLNRFFPFPAYQV